MCTQQLSRDAANATRADVFGCQVYSSLDLTRGHLEEKGETEEKKSESPLTVDSLSWTPDFAEM